MEYKKKVLILFDICFFYLDMCSVGYRILSYYWFVWFLLFYFENYYIGCLVLLFFLYVLSYSDVD